MIVIQIKLDWGHTLYSFPLFATKKNLSNAVTVVKNGDKIMA